MSRMSEQYQQEQDRENLSGMDDYLEWVYSMEQDSVKLIKVQENDKRRDLQQTQTPF